MTSDDRTGVPRGIVVLGMPRSGTTLLRRLLDAHPDIVCPAETNVLSACARFIREDTIAEGVRVGVLAGLGHAGFSRAAVLRRLREFAFGFHEDLARAAGKRRWAEKTAFDAFHIDAIEELCGDELQFICLIRNALDVVCSLHELSEKNHGYLPELHAYVRRYPNFYEAFAHCWVDLTSKLLGFVERRGSTALLVRYEDLVERPIEELTRLFTFLGEPFRAELIEAAMAKRDSLGLGDWKTYGKREIDPSTIGRGSELSVHTRGMIGRIVNPTLARSGYSAIPEAVEEDEARRQRRYELGLVAQRLMGEAGTPKGQGQQEGSELEPGS
jgi:protein-tyrosine sulfotransferase